MRIVKLIPIIFFLGLLLFAFPTKAKAKEGTINLVGNNTQCLGMSVAVSSTSFSILMRCENLIYPPSPNTIYYYVWAEGDKTSRLGDLDLGRAAFKASKPFSNVFVTIESQRNPSSPSDSVVMKGEVKPFVFPNTTGEQPTTTETVDSEKVTDTQTAQQIDEQSESTNAIASITSFLLRAGIIILVVVAIVGIILFVISKIR